MSSKNETKNIRAALILEILGKPAEHLTETLGKIIEEMQKEKGVKLISEKIHEPKELEQKKGFFSTFAEIEVEVEEISYLAILMFKYMPAHVEIIEPELIALTNSGWSDIFSELTRRLHGYEEIARMLQMQNQQMQQKLIELQGNKVGENNSGKVKEEKVVKKKEVGKK